MHGMHGNACHGVRRLEGPRQFLARLGGWQALPIFGRHPLARVATTHGCAIGHCSRRLPMREQPRLWPSGRAVFRVAASRPRPRSAGGCLQGWAGRVVGRASLVSGCHGATVCHGVWDVLEMARRFHIGSNTMTDHDTMTGSRLYLLDLKTSVPAFAYEGKAVSTDQTAVVSPEHRAERCLGFMVKVAVLWNDSDEQAFRPRRVRQFVECRNPELRPGCNGLDQTAHIGAVRVSSGFDLGAFERTAISGMLDYPADDVRPIGKARISSRRSRLAGLVPILNQSPKCR